MPPILLAILLIAFSGSALGSIVLALAMPGDTPRVVAGLAATSMFFTVPGTIFLMGVGAKLTERGVAPVQRGMAMAVLGACTGALILAFGGWHLVGWGALFGLTTAIMLLAIEPFLQR